jgi:ketosteroid isomerase-like protein
MHRCVVTLAFLLILSNAPIAQSNSAEEKAIRDLIAKEDAGQRAAETTDSIFFSGALKRPRVGRDAKAEVFDDVKNRIGQKIKTNVQRIDVAKSADMAYEFSDVELTNEEKGPDGKPRSNTFMTSQLRVWKKVGGQWVVAAHFVRPHAR